MLQRVAVYHSVLQCVAACQTKYRKKLAHMYTCSVLQCVVVCCSVLQCVAACQTKHRKKPVHTCRRSVLQCVALCCSVLLCVAVCCSVLQCAALCQTKYRKEPARMGWLRLVGSSKLQLSFAKEPYKRDYILQKRLIILYAVCCSVLQCVAVSCSVLLQRVVAVCRSVYWRVD